MPDMFGRSGDPQRLLDGFWIARDDEEVGARRSLRNALALLPVAERVDVETEPRCEYLLGQTQTRADLPDVHADGNMDTACATVTL